MDHQIASSSYNAFDTFGEPEIQPRVGNEYQAELPQLREDSTSFSRSINYTDGEIRDDILHTFHVGSRIELAWISSSRATSSLQQPKAKRFKKAHTSCLSHDLRAYMEDSEKLLVPEICEEEWTESEKDCFLLGLYAFAKNFVDLKKLVETKDMRALHSYYYGKFYSSPEHHRWSTSRKTKRKEGTIFSGLRLQEFLSRLLPRVGQCQKPILKVSKSFEKGKISMAEYILSLKEMVGAESLVEAAGIGRRRQGLSSAVAMKNSRSNLSAQTHHHLPSKKGLSSLTTTEIVSLLNGDQRLSKSRSSDLFWEAVWPRLLANGWHSEQHESYKHIAGSSPGLLFIIPGIENFSRRRYTKGYHYFDSLSDVLREVARDPSLIVLNHDEEWKSKENDKRLWYVFFRRETSLLLMHKLSTKTLNECATIERKHGHGDVSNALAPKKKKKGMQENNQDHDQDQARTQDQKRPHLLIDLNLPPQNEDGSTAAESSHEQNSTPDKLEMGDESSPNTEGYNTRQRPPTTRVLEARAHGYIVKWKQPSNEASNDDRK